MKPGELASHSDFHLFKMGEFKVCFSFMLLPGIKPMWEDEANKFGGKWIVRLRKGKALNFGLFTLLSPGLSSRCWENLVLAMLGEQFMVGEEICGAVVSIRFQEDILRSDDANKFSLNCFLLFFRFSTFFFFSIWNRTACDQAVTNRIRDTFRRVSAFYISSLSFISICSH